MSRGDIHKRSGTRGCHHTGIPGNDAAALGCTRRAKGAKEEPEIKCNAQLSEQGFDFECCGFTLNSSNARKVRNGSRLIQICGECEGGLKKKYPGKIFEINQLIHQPKLPRQKPPGSEREKKQEEQKTDL